ncbi:MAG: DUF3373 domain-containing protein [Epsilonproteobacteria bacterium]|nr:DUF3373 domain-containing protein [Campylobacterota bacterium]
MRKIILLSAAAVLSTSLYAQADLQAQVDALTKKVKKLEKNQKRTKKTLNAVKAHDAFDNIKFTIDFRNAVDVLDYKNNRTGERASNDSLLTSKLFLNMKAAPTDELTFYGKLAVYSMWGGHLNYTGESLDTGLGLKDWSGSSKASDTVMRVKEAYFVYANNIGNQPYSVSIGRRPSTNGTLANYRENEPDSGSPLAHITNMEVDALMIKFNWDRFIEGSYSKFVYGRAHTGDIDNIYGIGTTNPFSPYAETEDDDDDVDFFVFLGDAYNNGQVQLMYQWAHIFNTKGKNLNNGKPKKAAGTADLGALSLKIDGLSEDIEFLENTTVFASFAATKYNPKEGYSLLGSTGSETGTSYWFGVLIPDLMTDDGKFGIEYNHGSQYWTPMTWAEDTAIGSKIAVRGNAYEAYWNFNLFGAKNLPSQIRYTYVQHEYTPNVKCAGWIKPESVDMTSQDIRVSVSYRY